MSLVVRSKMAVHVLLVFIIIMITIIGTKSFHTGAVPKPLPSAAPRVINGADPAALLTHLKTSALQLKPTPSVIPPSSFLKITGSSLPSNRIADTTSKNMKVSVSPYYTLTNTIVPSVSSAAVWDLSSSQTFLSPSSVIATNSTAAYIHPSTNTHNRTSLSTLPVKQATKTGLQVTLSPTNHSFLSSSHSSSLFQTSPQSNVSSSLVSSFQIISVITPSQSSSNISTQSMSTLSLSNTAPSSSSSSSIPYKPSMSTGPSTVSNSAVLHGGVVLKPPTPLVPKTPPMPQTQLSLLKPITPPTVPAQRTPTPLNPGSRPTTTNTTQVPDSACTKKPYTSTSHSQLCDQAMYQFPACLTFQETEPAGSILVSVNSTSNISLSVSIVEPTELVPILQGYFNIGKSLDEFTLELAQPIDVEGIYERTGKGIAVKELILQLHCSETVNSKQGHSAPVTSLINVTVLDVDDKAPVFRVASDEDSACVVPVYKADADEMFMGELTFTPGQVEAVDGDLFTKHKITYDVKHADPDNYDEYFLVNTDDGSVNKTRMMNASDPRQFVLFVQATENSYQKRSVMGLIVITVISQKFDNRNTTVDPKVRYTLWVLSALIILGFIVGTVVIILHRRQRKTPEKCPALSPVVTTLTLQDFSDAELQQDEEEEVEAGVEKEKVTEEMKIEPVQSERSMATSVSSVSQIRVSEWKGGASRGTGPQLKLSWSIAYKGRPLNNRRNLKRTPWPK